MFLTAWSPKPTVSASEDLTRNTNYRARELAQGKETSVQPPKTHVKKKITKQVWWTLNNLSTQEAETGRSLRLSGQSAICLNSQIPGCKIKVGRTWETTPACPLASKHMCSYMHMQQKMETLGSPTPTESKSVCWLFFLLLLGFSCWC